MATGNNNSALFFSISEGKICRQVKSPTATSKERVNKTGKTVHEEFYDYIDGKITEVSVRESEYGKFWNVTLQDGETRQVLQFNYSSGYANGFLKALPNVDLSSKVKITPNVKIEGDKKRTTVFITQHGSAIKWFYTKENPNGLPPLKKIKVKGKDTWDDSEVMEFLEEMVSKQISPKLSTTEEPVAYPSEWDNHSDDLPM